MDKFKNKEIVELYEGHSVLIGIASFSIVKPANRNRRKFKVVYEDIMSIKEPTEKYNEFEKQKATIQKKYGEKDDLGNYKMRVTTGIGGINIQSYIIKEEKKPQFKKDIEALNKKYNKDIEAYELQLEEFNKALKLTTEIEIDKISEKILPKNIKYEQMIYLDYMLKD